MGPPLWPAPVTLTQVFDYTLCSLQERPSPSSDWPTPHPGLTFSRKRSLPDHQATFRGLSLSPRGPGSSCDCSPSPLRLHPPTSPDWKLLKGHACLIWNISSSGPGTRRVLRGWGKNDWMRERNPVVFPGSSSRLQLKMLRRSGQGLGKGCQLTSVQSFIKTLSLVPLLARRLLEYPLVQPRRQSYGSTAGWGRRGPLATEQLARPCWGSGFAGRSSLSTISRGQGPLDARPAHL